MDYRVLCRPNLARQRTGLAISLNFVLCRLSDVSPQTLPSLWGEGTVSTSQQVHYVVEGRTAGVSVSFVHSYVDYVFAPSFSSLTSRASAKRRSQMSKATASLVARR